MTSREDLNDGCFVPGRTSPRFLSVFRLQCKAYFCTFRCTFWESYRIYENGKRGILRPLGRVKYITFQSEY